MAKDKAAATEGAQAELAVVGTTSPEGGAQAAPETPAVAAPGYAGEGSMEGPTGDEISSLGADAEVEALYDAHLVAEGQAPEAEPEGDTGITGDAGGVQKALSEDWQPPQLEAQPEPEGEAAPAGEQPAPAAPADGDFFMGQFKSKEEAEAGFRATQNWGHELAGENAQLKAQLAALQQPVSGQQPAQQPGQQTPPTGDGEFKPLSVDDEKKLFYDNEDRYIEYQAEKTAFLVDKAKREAKTEAVNTIRQESAQSSYAQMDKQLTGYLTQTYPEMASPQHQSLVVQVLQGMSQDVAQRAQYGQVSADEQVFWREVAQNPTKAVDAAVEQLNGLFSDARAQGSLEARTQRERLPVNPVMAPGGAGAPKGPGPEMDTPLTEDAYMRELSGGQKALHPVL